MRSCTQIDIAKAVGVSQRAVAAVVGKGGGNNGVRVSEEKRRLILETAKRMNYRPHHQAQLLRGVKSGQVGILKTVGRAEYHHEKAHYATIAAQAGGYMIITSDFLSMGALDRSVDMVLDAKVEGVILVGFTNEIRYDPLTKLKKSGLPVVAMPGGGMPGFPSVVTDHRRGVHDLVVHLAGIGHRSMLYVAPQVDDRASEEMHWTHKQRISGFWDGIKEMQHSRGDILFLSGDSLFGGNGDYDLYYPGKLIAEDLLKRKKLPDAILCSNDDWAIGLLGELHRAGIRVPDDVAVVGFDGATTGGYTIPRLTTIKQNTHLLGEKAAELLFRIMGGEKLSEEERITMIPGELVIRESCGFGKKGVNV